MKQIKILKHLKKVIFLNETFEKSCFLKIETKKMKCLNIFEKIEKMKEKDNFEKFEKLKTLKI